MAVTLGQTHVRSAVRAHLENAAQFLELLRDAHLRLDTKAWLKQLCHRCEANLDGLRIAGAYAIDMAKEGLEDEPEVAAVLALLLAESACERAVELLDHSVAEVCEGARWGLRLAPCRSLASRLIETGPSAAALDILAFHRMPIPGKEPPELGSEQNIWSYIEAAGRSTNVPWSATDLERFIGPYNDLRIRRAAWRAAARRGMPELVDYCREAALAGDYCALEFLGIIGSAQDLALLQRGMSTEETCQAALAAIGQLGLSGAIPFLIEALDQADLSEWAAAAIERITGDRLARQGAPISPPRGLTEDELDVWEPRAPVDIRATRRWWASNTQRFAPGERWQAGLCVSHGPLRASVFDCLPLRFRYDVYLRERGLTEGTPDWELETWSCLQMTPECDCRGDKQTCR